ncbi:MAG: DegV family protein [Aerococcus sp.]|nr:DegV family protein [Aerococcus sp.]
MKAAILTDGTFALPDTLTNRNDIFEFKLLISFADGETLEGQYDTDEMEKFYHRLEQSKELPKTSQVRPAELYQLFDRMVAEGFDTLFVLAIPSGLSGTAQTIQGVAREYEDRIQTHLLSHRSIASTIVPLVALTAQYIDEGRDIHSIIERVRWVDQHQAAWASVASLDSLVKSGRASRFSGFLGNLFHVIPIIKSALDGGLELSEKTRTQKQAYNKIVAAMVEDAKRYPGSVAFQIMHADNRADADKVKAMLNEVMPEAPVEIVWLSSVIGVHIGPGSLAFGCLPGVDNYDLLNGQEPDSK